MGGIIGQILCAATAAVWRLTNAIVTAICPVPPMIAPPLNGCYHWIHLLQSPAYYVCFSERQQHGRL
eukprot:scaffold238198_cov19-Prasinocladus_malaysianus.AAC.1